MKAFLYVFISGLIMSMCGHAHEASPRAIRLHVMTVEMSEIDYRKMMRREQGKGKHTDYQYVKRLIKSEKAEILDVNVISCQPDEIARLESIREEIYPTEYDVGDGLSVYTPKDSDKTSGPSSQITESCHTFSWLCAFETRNTGVTLEIEPTLAEDWKTVSLKYSPEMLERLRLEKYYEERTAHSKNEIKFPIFGTQRTDTRVSLTSGKFALVTTTTPKTKDGKNDKQRKLLTFLMAEVVVIKW